MPKPRMRAVRGPLNGKSTTAIGGWNGGVVRSISAPADGTRLALPGPSKVARRGAWQAVTPWRYVALMPTPASLRPGLYDALIDRRVRQLLNALDEQLIADETAIDLADLPERVGRLFGDALRP